MPAPERGERIVSDVLSFPFRFLDGGVIFSGRSIDDVWSGYYSTTTTYSTTSTTSTISTTSTS